MKKTRPLAILNGFGRSLGDGIIGLQAAFAALRRGAIERPVLYRHPAGSPMVRALYDLARDFVDVAELPLDLAGSPPQPLSSAFCDGFADIVDIRDFAFDPAFRGVAMIDFFLTKLGQHAETLPAAWRRNTWLAPRVRLARPVGLPADYILFCPRASMPQRDIPPDVQMRLMAMMRDTQRLPIVTQGVALGERVIGAPDCTDIRQLCGLVAGAALVVSTDTAMLHLADAFAKPCLSIFTTHRPEWRVRDYPLATAVRMPVQGVPDGLEFIRSNADLMAIGAAWVDGGEMLEAALQRFLHRCCETDVRAASSAL